MRGCKEVSPVFIDNCLGWKQVLLAYMVCIHSGPPSIEVTWHNIHVLDTSSFSSPAICRDINAL